MDCLLPESLDISTVLDTTTQYKNWLTQANELHIDASEVVRVDAAGIQALTALFLTAKRNQIEVQLINPPNPLLEGISTLGLKEQFEKSNSVGE